MQASYRLGLAVFGTLVVLGTPLTRAHCQNFGACSADDVHNAIDELGCFAEGIYLSPENAADQLAELCADTPSERGCHFCFSKGRGRLMVAFKALVKLGLLERTVLGSLRQVLQEMEGDTCSDLNPPPPEDTPPAEETPAANPPSFESPQQNPPEFRRPPGQDFGEHEHGGRQ